MKKLLLAASLFISLTTFAQVPQGISYQAIALNGSGNAVVSANVGIRLSVLDNSASGTVLYTETHVKTTNNKGLFNLVIGQGTPTTGTFSTINWGTNSKFLKVEMDVAGGTNYALTGTTQLLSVPYAMYAEKTGSIGDNANVNDEIFDNKYSNFAFTSGGNTYAFNQKTASWVSQSGSGTIYESNGNFCFTTAGNTYAFNKNTGAWVSQAGSGTINSSNGNFCFTTAGNTYVFCAKTNTWVSQAGSATIYASNGNFCFATAGTTYAFNKNTGAWVSQSGTGTINSSNGSFYFSTAGFTYVFSPKTNTWISQSGTATITVSPSN